MNSGVTDVRPRPAVVPGLVSVTFRQLAPARVVELAADAGLRAVEWGGDVHVPVGNLRAAEHVRGLCAGHDLAVASYGSYFRPGSDAAADFVPVVETAVALGAPSVRVWAGRLGSGEATERQRADVVDGLAKAVVQAAEHDLKVALEFHPGTLTDTVDSTLALLDEVRVLLGTSGPAAWTYWQPGRGTPTPAQARDEVRALGRHLMTAHVFSWSADGARLPLADRADLWQGVLADLRGEQGAEPRAEGDAVTRFALLEFVRDDDPGAFRQDAASLLDWLDG
ncbi:TIM barrel protein [Actinopolymorpha sp. B17G11]|uniref:sugar phosphate isomerase/epimerase family protein n=1 Tax=Actinopolymorpha sp. B17G11 TaxID=3160861 RepID=UPI0032E4406F